MNDSTSDTGGDSSGGAPESAEVPTQSEESEEAVVQVVDAGESTPGEDAQSSVDSTEDLVAERDEFKQQLMRTTADFENFRRRTRARVEDARVRGRDGAVLELLPVIDNLERAVAAAKTADNVASAVEGIQMVLTLFQDISERMGLSRVRSVGEPFDPAMHQAIQQLETNEYPPGTIVSEMTPGYMFSERLLRPALVLVAKYPEKMAPESTVESVPEAPVDPEEEAKPAESAHESPPVGHDG